MVLSITLVAFAVWLQVNDRAGWPQEDLDASDDSFRVRRHRRRTRVNVLLGSAGLVIAVAAAVGPGPVWVGCWMIVILILCTVIVLALLDAFRTRRHYQQKMRDVRDRLT